jgi:hypothetical protein
MIEVSEPLMLAEEIMKLNDRPGTATNCPASLMHAMADML